MLSACYVIREKTFAGTHGNERDAPIPVVHVTAVEPLESTLTDRSLPATVTVRNAQRHSLSDMGCPGLKIVADDDILPGGTWTRSASTMESRLY
jgi:hypothetical protein